MNEILATARHDGIAQLFLRVQKVNQSAVGFYSRNGLRVVGEESFRVGARNHEALVMRLALATPAEDASNLTTAADACVGPTHRRGISNLARREGAGSETRRAVTGWSLAKSRQYLRNVMGSQQTSADLHCVWVDLRPPVKPRPRSFPRYLEFSHGERRG